MLMCQISVVICLLCYFSIYILPHLINNTHQFINKLISLTVFKDENKIIEKQNQNTSVLKSHFL